MLVGELIDVVLPLRCSGVLLAEVAAKLAVRSILSIQSLPVYRQGQEDDSELTLQPRIVKLSLYTGLQGVSLLHYCRSNLSCRMGLLDLPVLPQLLPRLAYCLVLIPTFSLPPQCP